MSKTVSRSSVNEQQYSAQEFPKSGFNMSHRRYGSYIIGRLQCDGYQYVMPGDKISGNNKGNFTMKNLVTPMVSQLDVSQYDVYLPFRAIDKTFMKGIVPTKLNNMSSGWSTPKVSTRYLIKELASTYDVYGDLATLFTELDNPLDLVALQATVSPYDNNYTDYLDMLYGGSGIITKAIGRLEPGGLLFQQADALYMSDVCQDIIDNIKAKLGTIDNPLSGTTKIRDFVGLLLDALFTPFVGRYSYYADYRYKYLRPNDIRRICQSIGTSVSNLTNWYEAFDDTPLCEYALRTQYVIWYEHFRNVDLEPEAATLPDWREFGSTSIFDINNGGNFFYLVYRPRPWYDDMFMNAQVDDMSRHVWAPILIDDAPNAAIHANAVNNHDANAINNAFAVSKPAEYILTYRDQLTDTDMTVVCPVPTNINDILSQNDLTFLDVYGLDLNSLRQAQQLERYLKRNYLFGDEYQDRMLAHYSSRVSDLRINRPEIISRSLNSANMGQEIANMSNGVSNAGDRTATGTLVANGKGFSMYAEEFGILVHLISFMPLASYDGICPQLLMSKVMDFPLPEFATNNEEFGRKCEIADSAIDPALIGNSGSDSRYIFGRFMAYHAWRSRVDEVAGDFLNELQDCTFRRFWGMYSDDTTPKLNYYIIHCRPNLGMFRNTNVYDAQIYGDVVHECFVERVLPTPVEQI